MSAAILSAAVFAALAALYASLRPPADSDMWWHLASGSWMLEHGRVLDRDVFSHTRAGTEYQSGQWLGQILLELALRTGGWPGVVALRAALVAISAYFVARATLRLQPHIGWAAPPIIATLLVSSTTWGDRPQLWTVAFFPLVLDVLLAVRLGASSRRLLLLPPLFLLWANLHAGFTAGLALIAIFTLEAIWSRAPSARVLAATAVAAFVLSLPNPAGLGALGRGTGYIAGPPAYIVEERPVSLASGIGVTFVVMGAAAIASGLVLWRRRRTLAALRLWPLLVVPFAFLGLMAQRQLPLASAVLAPFVAAAVPIAIGRMPVLPITLPLRAARIANSLIALVAAATVVAVAPRGPDVTDYPAGALPTLRSLPGNLLNEYDWGGYLIREAPSHPVFIDGRGPLLFVPDVLEDFERMVGAGPDHAATLRKWDIALVLVRPDRPLAAALARMGWRSAARSEGRWVLLARP